MTPGRDCVGSGHAAGDRVLGAQFALPCPSMDDNELRPPTVSSAKETGLVLDVAAVGIDDPAAPAYVRCTDGRTFRLPDPLFEWATTLIDLHYRHRIAGNPSMFPTQIEFGTRGGGMYAELL
jgi:hypothetical protein